MPTSHVNARDRVVYEGAVFIVDQVLHEGIDLLDAATESRHVYVPASEFCKVTKFGRREEVRRRRGKPADYYLVYVGRGVNKLSMGATDSYEQAISWIRTDADREGLQHGTCTLVMHDYGFHAVYSTGMHILYEITPHYISR